MLKYIKTEMFCSRAQCNFLQRSERIFNVQDADEVEEVGPEGDAVAEVKEDEPAKEVAKTPGRGRGRGRRGKRT